MNEKSNLNFRSKKIEFFTNDLQFHFFKSLNNQIRLFYSSFEKSFN